MTTEARTLLQEIKDQRLSVRPTDRVLLTSRGRPLNTKALDRRWRNLKKKEVDGVETDRLKKTTAHVLRHTYASHLAQAGVSLTRLALYLGHSSAYVTERYTHLSPADDDDVGAMLSSQLSRDTGTVRDRVSEILPGLAGLSSAANATPLPEAELLGLDGMKHDSPRVPTPGLRKPWRELRVPASPQTACSGESHV